MGVDGDGLSCPGSSAVAEDQINRPTTGTHGGVMDHKAVLKKRATNDEVISSQI